MEVKLNTKRKLHVVVVFVTRENLPNIVAVRHGFLLLQQRLLQKYQRLLLALQVLNVFELTLPLDALLRAQAVTFLRLVIYLCFYLTNTQTIIENN